MKKIYNKFTPVFLLLALILAHPLAAQTPSDGTVKSFQKISDTEGSFTASLDNSDHFGLSVSALGDLDGDGVGDLAVGAYLDDDGGTDRGAVYVLFMQTDGTVKSFQKISDTAGSFTGTLDDGDLFGVSVAALGDLDGDGVIDLAVGADYDDDGGADRGAVYVLFMQTDGTVKSFQKISDTEGSFTATLDNIDYFGRSLAALGDLDGDGVADLAVGACADDDGGYDHGAVYVLFMKTDGTVKSFQKISDTEGNFTATLSYSNTIGTSVSALGDLDGDGVADLAMGAPEDDDGGQDRGSVYILFMKTDGTVKSYQKISDTAGNFTGDLNNGDFFGISVSALGDLDGDGVSDLAVGAYGENNGGADRGAVYVLFMQNDGVVKSYQKISDTAGSFTATLDDSDRFGLSVAALGDLDGDGVADLAVGADNDDDGGENRGAVYVLFLQDAPPAALTISGKITYPGYEQNYPNGEIFIDVWENPTQWPFPPESPVIGFPIGTPVDLITPVSYVIDDPILQAGSQYYVMVTFDEDNTQQPFMPEAEGFWGSDLATGAIDLSAGSVSGINFALQPLGVGGVDYESQIRPIFSANCALSGCHVAGHQTGLDLTAGNSYGMLVSVTSTNYAPALRVEPFNANNSVLYNKVENTGVYGGQMPPPPNPALAPGDIQLIMDWINEGAQQGGEQGGTIEGTVSSKETVTGDLWVGLFEPTADPNYWDQRSTESFLGNYVFPVSNINFSFQEPFIIDGDGYFVMAFVDENFNGTPDPFELLGMSPSVMVTGGYGNTGDIFMTFGAGGGFSFDFGATGGYAETNFTVLDGGPQITVELFFKLHRSYGPGEQYELIGRNNWTYLEYDGDTGEFYFGLEGIGEIEWQHSPNPGEWHHLAVDYDGVNMTIYWDGEMKASIATGGGNLPTAPPDMQIGEGFDGLADVIRISDVALYYPNNFDPWTQGYSPNSNTHLLYHCNEGSGNQLIDDSGHEHHAIITGNPTWDPDEPLGPVAEGRIAGNVSLNEEWAPAQVFMGLWFPGKNPDFDSPDLSLQWGVDPPFSVSYEFVDSGIQPGVPYVVGTFFDANGNGSLDGDEPQGEKGNLNVPASNELMGVDFVLSSQPGGHVEGNIHSGESASGNLIIGLFEPGNSSEWSPDFELVNQGISFPPDFFYAFDDPGIYDASGWEVRAFLDKDDDYWPESDEMQGASGTFQISGGSAYGIDFDLFPPGAGPQIGISTTELNFTEYVDTLEFQVGNVGQDILYWEIYVEYDSSGTLDWIISVEPSEGSSTSPDEDKITVIITPTGFEEAAEIYVDGYSDPDYNNWIGDRVINVYMDAWLPGTGKFETENDNLFIVAEENAQDSIGILFSNSGNGPYVITNVVSSLPDIFFSVQNFPKRVSPGETGGILMVIKSPDAPGTITGDLIFQLFNASTSNFTVDFSIDVYATGTVTINTEIIDSVNTGLYDLHEEVFATVNFLSVNNPGEALVITFIDGTIPTNAAGDQNMAVAPRYWEISSTLAEGDFSADICFDLSDLDLSGNPIPGIRDFNSLKIIKRDLYSDDNWTIVNQSDINYDEGNNIICAVGQNSFSQWTVGSDSSGTNFVPALPEVTVDLVGVTAKENNPLAVNIRATADAGLKELRLRYWIGGDSTIRDAIINPLGGDMYRGIIQANRVTNKGLIGFVSANDSLNRRITTDTTEIRVEFDSLFIYSTTPETYSMISVPGDLNNKNAQPILFEEYDNTQVRLFRWKNNGYQEYPSMDKLDPGKAFWIITLDATTLMSGSGTSTRLIPSYTINLDQGWNQIGTPYNFGNDINDLQYTVGSIELPFYEYDGTGYSTTNMMDPGKGYWLYAHEATSIKVNPRGPGLAKLMVEGVPHPLNWGGRVKASTGNVNDSENVFGVILSASETWDEFDRHEPPVIGDYITLAFDNRNWESRGGLYAQDIQPEGMEGYLWQFVVKTNQEGYVNLDVEKIKELPLDWDLFVLDMDLKIVHKAQEMNQYRFVSTGSEIERNFSLVVGPDSFTKEVIKDYNFVPTDYTLLQNVPNPFNAITTIRFGLPEDGKVSLTIYSILGQKVAAVISEQEFTAGSHAILWDGKNDAGRGVATGVYLYYLTVRKDGATKFHQARKLVLLK